MSHATSTLALAFLIASIMLALAARTPAQTPQPTDPGAPPTGITFSTRSGPLEIGVVGLTHGHVEGLLGQARQRDDLKIVGIYEPDRAIFDAMARKYDLAPSLYFPTLDGMLDVTKPEAVSVMAPIRDHLAAVQACAPRGIHLLLEKPLAFSASDAHRMAELSTRHRVLVLTNFETSWYASIREARRLIASGDRAPLRKMVFRHGHKGPREIGCSPEFLAWLTDPAQNGGGAIVDFGCYGAVLATWLMDGARPISVAASATTLKPLQYPHVDDDATIILTYRDATAIIQASWAWTHDNKEADFHTERGSVHAAKWNALTIRDETAAPSPIKPPPLPPHLADEWTYLKTVVRGGCAVDPLSSLDLNVIVAEILDVARADVANRR